MSTTTLTLTAEQFGSLRMRHPYPPNTEEVIKAAREHGWLEANTHYLEGERLRGAAAMRDLLRELGIDRVRSVAEAVDLIAFAWEVFSPGESASTLRREAEGTLRITTAPCPVYKAFEGQHWLGVTACASWHRRRGWFDALGVSATDSVEAEMKWGDPACVTLIEVQGVLG